MSPAARRRAWGSLLGLAAVLVPALGWVADRTSHAVDTRYLHAAIYDSALAARRAVDSAWHAELRGQYESLGAQIATLKIAIDSANIRIRQMNCPPQRPACR